MNSKFITDEINIIYSGIVLVVNFLRPKFDVQYTVICHAYNFFKDNFQSRSLIEFLSVFNYQPISVYYFLCAHNLI